MNDSITIYKVWDLFFICFFSETKGTTVSAPASLHVLCLHVLPCAPVCNASVNAFFM